MKNLARFCTIKTLLQVCHETDQSAARSAELLAKSAELRAVAAAVRIVPHSCRAQREFLGLQMDAAVLNGSTFANRTV